MQTRFEELPLDEKRAFINTCLHEGEATVIFTKVNGERRVMPCTLKPELLPVVPVVEGKEVKEKKENPTVIRAFCTDKQEWRSFRIDSVISITPTT